MRASGILAQMMDLVTLLDNIDRGNIALPEFQRDFDWSEEDVRELLVTVFSGWPAGSLLLLQGRQELFRLRSFEGAPSHRSEILYVVLDGQQRLTSLYHALYKQGSNVYAIRLDAVAENEGLEEAIEAIGRSEWEEKFDNLESQAQEGLIPCYHLTSPSDFFEWRDEVSPYADDEERYKSQLTLLYRRRLAAIHRYEFPAVILQESVEPAAIARIFERVNRLGMRLNTFDLMVAKVFEPHWNLRDQWDRAKTDHPHLDTFLDDDGMPVLQTTALRVSGDVRQSAVLDLDKRVVHEDWKTAARGVEKAAHFFMKNCGVANYGELPYKGMLVLFAATVLERDPFENVEAFSRMFWGLSFGQAYDVAANTRIVGDFKALKGAGGDPTVLTLPKVDEERLYYAARRGHRAVWAAFTSLLRVRDPAGLFSDLADEGDAEGTRIVSVFPRGMDPEIPEVAPPHLRVLSLVHAPRSVARRISKTGFPTVVSEFLDEYGPEGVQDCLHRQFFDNIKLASQSSGTWRDLIIHRLSHLGRILAEEFALEVDRVNGWDFATND